VNTIHIDTRNYWTEDGAEDPTTESIVRTMRWILKVYDDLGLLPYHVSATAADGMYFHYKKDDISIEVELYNDDDAVAIASNYKKKDILESVNLDSLNNFIEFIKKYY